jgi:hypothetical protein
MSAKLEGTRGALSCSSGNAMCVPGRCAPNAEGMWRASLSAPPPRLPRHHPTPTSQTLRACGWPGSCSSSHLASAARSATPARRPTRPGSLPPHLRRDWAHPSHICTGTGRSPPPHLRRDWTRTCRWHICVGSGGAAPRGTLRYDSHTVCDIPLPPRGHLACALTPVDNRAQASRPAAATPLARARARTHGRAP